MLLSHLPFVIPEDKRMEMAIAVGAVNFALSDGCFDYNIASGQLFFRMTNAFMDCVLSEEVFEYMLFVSCRIIDEYNDKFFMISKDLLPIDQFLSTLSK